MEGLAWPHTLEAAKDEARLIQDSLLPSGTLRGDAFEVTFRFAPLGEVGGDFADFFFICPMVWWECTWESSSERD